ncbi:redoxin domain-containing protein [Pseudoalteromonas obscura]|uniref:Redoxin domain-containing protein n=1 Tax=Pseudoalteromonas obscura TaxID=3048491 RepID=A0ABT7EKP6_9GAMM|nr:redoxin domain-containing protein [Pseudoalteromonas sp. P94(2023)]MDK2595631.1 redoxin domain-containing protein [Pseudoalteromonas sp. P94(2023)]
MQRLIKWFVITTFFAPAMSMAAAKIDAIAPDFTLQDSYGKTVTLSDFKGKYVVLEWTNHLCPYVKKHYGSDNMQSLQRKYTQQDIVWLSVISSAKGKQGHVDANKANDLTKTRNASPSHVLFDESGAVGRLYKAKTTPHMYIINPEGKLSYAGAIDSIKSANPADIPKATNYVVSSLTNLLAGKAINKKITKPYGCSIKYKS